jgi:WD40 repeat protein
LLQNTLVKSVLGVSFGPGGRTLAAGGSGGFDVWDLDAETNTHVPAPPTNALYALVHDPLGRWLYHSDPRNGGRIIDLPAGEARRFPGDPYEHHVLGVAAARDGRLVAISRGGAMTNRLECWRIGREGQFRPAWSAVDGKVLKSCQQVTIHQGGWFIRAVAVSADGRKVAAVESRPGQKRVQENHVLVLRDAATGALRAELGQLPLSLGFGMLFTPDGERVIGWEERWLQIRATTADALLGELTPPGPTNFRGLAVHPSGRFFATASGDGQARFWDPDTLQPVEAFKWGIGKLHSVAFSPDGMLAAAGGDKGQVVVWDVEG